jgi:hypothetical protein
MPSSKALLKLLGGKAKAAKPATRRDVEADSKAELSDLQRGIRERAAAENQRRQKATDSEYWVCLCFQNREQAEAFGRAAGIGAAKYADGRKVAKRYGIELPDDGPAFSADKKPDPTWAGMTKGAKA